MVTHAEKVLAWLENPSVIYDSFSVENGSPIGEYRFNKVVYVELLRAQDEEIKALGDILDKLGDIFNKLDDILEQLKEA